MYCSTMTGRCTQLKIPSLTSKTCHKLLLSQLASSSRASFLMALNIPPPAVAWAASASIFSVLLRTSSSDKTPSYLVCRLQRHLVLGGSV